jgi:hypothetical protein
MWTPGICGMVALSCRVVQSLLDSPETRCNACAMNSTTQQLATFMAEHNITGHVNYVGTSTDSDKWEHHDFRFTLEINDDLYLGNAPYMAGMAHNPSDVTIEDCFGAVLSDITSVEGYDDWTDWADDLGIVEDAKSAKKAQTDFQEIKARASLLYDAIGGEAFAEALEIEQ